MPRSAPRNRFSVSYTLICHHEEPQDAKSTYLNCQELERAAIDAGLGAKESLKRILSIILSSQTARTSTAKSLSGPQ
jgi:hypothetical protein